MDAVVVTGGEPTLHQELPKFLKRLKERGFAVKLDTNGFYPEVLEECLAYVDYVALDVKTSLEKYWQLGAGSTAGLMRTLTMLKTGKVDYEFRTTIVPGFVGNENIAQIGELVKGAKTLAIQQFVSGDTLDRNYNALKPYANETIARFAETVRTYTDNLIVRT